MKKITLSITAVLTALVLLASCGKTAVAAVGVQEIYQKITESVAMPEETLELVADDLSDYYGIDPAKVAEFAAVQDACGYKDEIVIVKAVDEAAAGEIAALLSGHIEYQKESMRSYDAAQYDILCSSRVITNGNYTAMFISAAQRTMEEIFQSFF